MKAALPVFFIFTLFLSTLACAQIYPTLHDYVTDNSGVLTASERAQIDSICRQIELNSSAQVAVLIVPTTSPDDMNLYANKVFTQNGLGQKGVDNGLLLVIATQDRKWRMEVGYGLEGVLPDSKVGTIGTAYLVPALKRGEWGTGIIDMLEQVRGEIKGESEINGEKKPDLSYLGLPKIMAPFFCIPLFIFAFMVFIIWLIVKNTRRIGSGKYRRYGRYRSGWGGWGGSGSGGFGGGSGGSGGFSGGGGSSGGGGAGGSF